jgi:hypothetical protein
MYSCNPETHKNLEGDWMVLAICTALALPTTTKTQSWGEVALSQCLAGQALVRQQTKPRT